MEKRGAIQIIHLEKIETASLMKQRDDTLRERVEDASSVVMPLNTSRNAWETLETSHWQWHYQPDDLMRLSSLLIHLSGLNVLSEMS